MKKLFLVLAAAFMLSGCITVHHVCSINGIPVRCSELNHI